MIQQSDDHKIAIIGYSCKFPDANNPEELWANLLAGKDSVRPIPDERSYIPGNEKLVGGFLARSLQNFDANFFNISPKRAPYLDPQQRLFLESVWESLENAGIPPSSLKTTKTGVFVGVCADDYKLYWRENVTQQDFIHEYVGNTWSAFPGQIAYFLDLHGPAIAVETACSSSAAAIYMGCQALRNKECPIVIAGGVNLLLDRIYRCPDVIVSDSCKTFDESANGFAPAEGCGIVVLKRYKDALEQGDNILGIILGTALNHDGHTRSLGTPNSAAQEDAIRGALKDAGVSPSDITFVEAHGTGTRAGDPCEIQAINAVFAGERKNGLVIGAIKPNIGHSLAASGVASLIKAIHSLNSGIVPKILHLRNPSSKLNLSMVPLILPAVNINLEIKEDLPMIAGLNSFGLSGTNVHFIIQAGPKQRAKPLNQVQIDTDMPSYHIVTISAKTENALESLSGKYADLLASPEMNEFSLADFSHAVNTQRDHFVHRISIVAKDKNEVLEQLKSKNYTKASAVTPSIKAGKIVFLFTGQGSLYSAVGKHLFDSSIIFRSAFQKCEEMVDGLLQMSLKKYLWEDEIGINPSIGILAGPALFSIQYCLLQVWTEQFGVKPDIVLGHSIGEFAACVAAGVLSFESAMGLICKRGQLVQKLEGGNMAAITATSLDHVVKLISKFSKSCPGNDNWIDIAAVNSKCQIVLAGMRNTLLDFFKFAEGQVDGMKLLNTSHAFHSRAIDPVLNEFGEFCKSVVHNSPTCVYVSSTEAKIINDAKEFSPQYWQNHFRNPVQFSKAVNLVLQSYHCSSFVEVGPQPVLLNLASEAIATCDGNSSTNALLCASLRRSNPDGWFTLLHSLATLHVNGAVNKIKWNLIGQACSLRSREIKLPHYPFQRKKHWLSASKDKHRSTISQTNLHPLLGYKTDLPKQSLVYYSNMLGTSTSSYFADHKVVDEVLLPGACFLEMALSAGQIASNGSSFYIEEFTLPNRLFLTETLRNVGTFVSPLEDGALVVETFSRLQDGKNWTHHSTSKIQAINTKPGSTQLEDYNQHLFFDFKSELSDSATISHSATEIYDALTQSGIQMGPQFRSLTNIWQKGDEFIFKLDGPVETEKYFCHPIILDAMIQSFWYCASMTENKKFSIFLPVGIQKLFWWNGLLTIGERECLYIRVLNEIATKQHVLLYDSAGHLLVCMQGISMVETTEIALIEDAKVQKIAAANIAEKNNFGKHPDFYIEDWMQLKTAATDRVAMSLVPGILSEELSTILKSVSENGGPIRRRCFEDLKLLNKLAYLYIVRCFYSCGWRPELEAIFTVNSVRELISKPEQPIPFNLMVLYRYLRILEEEGVLKMRLNCGILSEWEIIAYPPTINEIKNFITEQQAVNQDGADFKFLHYCGSNLVDIFRAEQSPLQVLFSEGTMNATQHYSQSPYLVQDSKDLAKVIEFIVTNSGKGGIFRILEIGAGTGATTAHILNKLEKIGRPYEYTYTDVAISLLSDSKRKFKSFGDKIDYQTLNIDRDPKDQYFCPHSFDLVIAANVLHATKDLAVSLEHVRELIVDQGYLLIVEVLQPTRVTDVSFALLDGWWSFTDSRAVDMSPLINFEKWSNILANTGFTNARNLTQLPGEYRSGVIIAQATSNALVKFPEQILSVDTKKNVWVIFNNNYDMVAKKLKAKLESVGKIVVEVKPDLSNSAMLNNVVHPKLYSSFENMFKTLKNGHSLSARRVDGVVFLSHSTSKLNILVEEAELMPIALMHLLKAAVLSTELTKVLVVAAGVHRVQTSMKEPINPTGSPLFGVLYSFRNEHPEIQCGCIDLDIHKVEEDPEGCALNIFSLLWKPDFEKVVAFRNKEGWVPRLKELKETHEDLVELQIPVCRYAIVESSSGSYKDIQVATSNFDTPNSDQIEVAVKAVGLNIRDLLGMSGLVDRSEKDGGHDRTIGIEYSGIVTSVPKNTSSRFLVGDRIFGVEFNGCMASHIRITNPDLIMRLPDRWSFAQGATAPIVYLTAYMALVQIANVKRGEHVLIHAASEGVGLAAIQLLKMLGAEIYVTAGTKRKRRYLEEIVGLRHVYDSRNHLYLDKITEATDGRGVDVVMNSITGVGFKEASLACLGVNRGARFIETGKLNIWTEVEIHEKRSDVKYVVLALEKLWTPISLIPCVKDLEVMFQEGKLDSIPYTSFPVSKVKSAFQYFHESKHIGKIVVKLDEDLFFSNHTYIITGGLGGIGLQVAKWILEKGGSHVVLVGRRAPDEVSEAVAANFKDLVKKSSGTLVFIKGDVSKLNECKDILDSISAKYPPLKGIFHSAGVLSDGFVLKQSAENFLKVFGPKVHGSWNLHELTKRKDLDYFVLFSSGTALFGIRGQSSHSAANCFLDSLAQYRVHELGLKTMSINWGAWAEVGVAANIVIPGWKKFTPKEGINGLQRAISDPGVHRIAIINIDSNVVEKFPAIKSYLYEFLIKYRKGTKSFVNENAIGTGQCQIPEENPDKLAAILNRIEEALQSKSKEAEKNLIDNLEILVEITFRFFSGIPASETIDRNQPMNLLGMDSMLEMEIRNNLHKLLKVGIPPGIVHESGTVSGLAEYLSLALRSTSKPI